MDKKKSDNKSIRQGSSRLTSAEQQAQLAFAQQLGIPPEFLGASLQGYGAASGMDAQRLLNPMATAGGYPFMNPAALQAFAGLNPLAGHSGAGEAELWNMAQNQALAASLAGFYPGSMGFPMVQPDTSQKSKSSNHDNMSKVKDENRKSYENNRMSPRPGSSGASSSHLHQERTRSIESMNTSSKERPESHRSSGSPYTGSKQSTSNAKSSWMDGLSRQQQQKMNEQVIQTEMMRQLEQQFLVHQFQLQQQQQQQDQLTAALQSVMTGSVGSLPGSSSHKKGSSDAEKMQQQMAIMMQQMMQAGGGASSMQGISPAMASSLFSTPGALETMMAMSQLGDMNPYAALGSSKNHKQEDRNSEHRDKNLPSSSYRHSSSLHNSSKSQKNISSPSPSSSRNLTQSSPQKFHQSSPLSVAKNSVYPIPGMPGAELTPDNMLLAAIQSQQLQQYEALIKQELEAVSRVQDLNPKSMPGESSKSKMHVKSDTHKDDTPSSSSHNQMNLYSPANSTSSRGRSHTSPHREYSGLPSRKQLEVERSQSRGSSTSKHLSPSVSKHGTKNHTTSNENMNDALKMFSNPNFSQHDLAALLGFPAGADPAALLASMAPYQFPANAGLLDTAQSTSQMTPEQLEKLNKDLAAALALETHKLQEQLRQQQLQMDNRKKGKDKDNHISVIHQNNKNNESSSHQSSSKDSFKKVLGKRSSDGSKSGERKIGNGDAASSDGDVNSEASGEKNNLPSGKNIRKRRRIITNEDEILEPLKHEWKREVRFKFAGSQLRGEVIYISPTGKKFRTYPDIIKHLEENKMTHLHRNNFSFSSRLRIGNFYEQREKEKGNKQWVKMTEEELDQLIQQLDRGQTSSPFLENCDQMSDSSSSKGDNKSAKKEKEQEKEKQKEQLKILRQQEKMQKLEQQRVEREIRERLALEELERQRMAEALEREQRRQHMILMRALETRKRAEERERRREELRIEKIMLREKKMEQRRIAMQIARELKMPVEDMKTIGAPELPNLTKLQGTYDNKCPHQLSGNACADVLMVLEFVKTFKECMRIEDSIIPSFEQLQLGLLNDPKHTPALVQITMSLLHQCLCDPGVPAPGPWLHCLTGVKVTDIDVGDANYSEILRLFIWARSGYKTEIAMRLETLPFLSLTTDEKAQSLAFLVNELVCSRPICMEIEKNLDMLATLRRDKWIVEGQMRQLRVAHEKNPILDSPVIKLEDEENSNSSMSSKKDLNKSGTSGGDSMKDEPQEETSLFQRRMEELTQQHNSYNSQLARSNKPLRAIDIGQDRYKRRYWVLPNLGGVYVEGLESGISYEDDEESPDEDEDDDEEEEDEQKHKEKKNLSKAPDANPEKEEPISLSNCENQNMDKQNGMTETQSSSAQEISDVTEMVTDQTISSAVQHTADANTKNTLENGASNNEINDLQSSIKEDSAMSYISNAVTASDLDKKSVCFNSSVPNENSFIDNQNLENITTKLSNQERKPENLQANSETKKLDKENCDFNQIENSDVSNACDNTQGSMDQVNNVGVSNHIGDDNTPSKIVPSPSVEPDHATMADTDICKLQTEKPNATEISENSFAANEHNSTVVTTSSADDQLSKSPVLSVTANKKMLKAKMSNEMDNDSVLAAAKAVAAKAVASSSHLLFPKNEIPTKTKQKTHRSPTKDKEKKLSSDSNVSSLPIGEHTINTLVQMGVNPTSLTSQQLEVLSSLDMHSSNSVLPVVPNLTKNNDKGSLDRKTDDDKIIDSKNCRKKSADDQDIPMDLTCSNNNSLKDDNTSTKNDTTAKDSLKVFPIKIEQGLNTGLCESPARDESDSKSFDTKYFVPISVTDNVKTESNQLMTSCPSPNTLANYIMASVNNCQLPALDDIKFPIRAPDVKEESDTIPRDKKRGWWRIESESELRHLSEKLHLRGIREKQLHRSITKNFEICTNSMNTSSLTVHQFAVLTKQCEANQVKSLDDKDELKLDGNTQTTKQNLEEDVSSRFLLAEKLAFESEMRILQQVESLAIRCVDMNVVPAQWRIDNPRPSMCRKDLAHVPLGPLRDKIGSEIKFDALNPIQHDSSSALGAAVDLLGCLERAVYRRYLKPPLVRKGGASEFSSLPSLSESGAMDVAHGLRIWRNAAASSSSASQLSLCIRQLDACIAWDRSTTLSPVKTDISITTKMKKRKPEKRTALKTKNRSSSPSQPKKRRRKKLNPVKVSSPDDAEDKQPKHSRMPIDTADVISKSVSSEDSNPTPISNGDAGETNPVSHMGDPNSPVLTNKNLQNHITAQQDFAQTNGQHFSESLSPHAAEYHTTSDNVSEEYKPASDAKKKKKKKKSKKIKLDSKEDGVKKPGKPRKRADKDTINCRNVLRELQSHEAATWFLFPVDCKLVPGYRKIIKKPIDFHTIESRLKRGRYKSKEDFVSEVRLVFDNCQKFNEDNSNIGRAGHQIREFFEERWSEVLLEKYGETEERSIEIASFSKTDIVPEIESNSVNSESELIPEYSYQGQDSSEGCLVMDES